MTASQDITPQQSRILDFIEQVLETTGRPPTIREIGRRFGFNSTGTTRDHLKGLSRRGLITITPRQSRAIRLTKRPPQNGPSKSPSLPRLPMLGTIAAGAPNIAVEEIGEYFDFDMFLPGPNRPIFALKVKGESMRDKGIHPGDIAIIRGQRTADAGDIVAALVGHDATIKTLEKNKGGFCLKAAHPSFPEIRDPFTILGKVIAVIKKF